MKEKWTELRVPVRQHQADNIKYALWESQNEKRERGRKNYLNNFWELSKFDEKYEYKHLGSSMKFQVRWTQRDSGWDTKAVGQNQIITHKGSSVRFLTYFSWETLEARRQCANIFKEFKGKYCEPESYSWQNFHQKWGRNQDILQQTKAEGICDL